jgi:hypothetical protein
LLVHSAKKRSACRNLFFYFFVHLRKNSGNDLPIGSRFLRKSGKFRKIDPIFSYFSS